MSKTIGLFLLATLFANTPNLFSAEGDGSYLLTLDGAIIADVEMIEKARLPLKVYLDRKDGKFRAGFAVGAMRSYTACDVDGSGLTLEQGKLKGPLKIGTLMTVPSTDLINNVTWMVDARMEGDAGKGTYTHSVRGVGEKAKPFDQQDSLTIEHEAPAPYPSTTRVEINIMDGINPKNMVGSILRRIFLQFVVTNGKATGGIAYSMGFSNPGHAHEQYDFLSIPRQLEIGLADGSIQGTFELDVPLKTGKEVYTLTLTGRAIAGRTAGNVLIKCGDTSWESRYSGRMIRSSYQPPLEWKKNTWTYEQLPVDTNLETMAKAEALVAVRPGEPGKTWFGTWPNVLRGVHGTISAPAYGFRERSGAVKYKYILSEGPIFPIAIRPPLTGVNLPKEIPVQEWDGTKGVPEKWMGELPEWGQSWMPILSPPIGGANPKKVYFFNRQKWDYLNQRPGGAEAEEAAFKLLPKTWVPTEEEWGIPGVSVSGMPWLTKLYPIAEKDVLPNGKGLNLAYLAPEIPDKYKSSIGIHQWQWKRKFHAFLSIPAPMFVTHNHNRARLNGMEWTYGQTFELAKGIYDYEVGENFAPDRRKGKEPPALVPGIKLVDPAEAARFRKVTEKTLASAPSFEADKPWRPLTPIWDKVEGDRTLTVLPLDKDGNVLPGLLDFEIADRDGTKLNEKITTVPKASIRIRKKTAFQGPYAKPARSCEDAVLKAARFLNNYPSPWATATKEMNFFPAMHYSGEGTTFFIVHQTFYSALYGSLVTKDPLEKKEWQEMYEFAGESLRMHTKYNASGLAHCYACYTFLNHFVGDDFLNLYQHTGGAKWKESAEKLAESLVKCQMPEGSWNEVKWWGNWANMNTHAVIGEPPNNFFVESCMQFDPSGVVRFLGRIRHDLKTEKFWEAEKKAYDYVMSHSVRQMLWVAQGEHSQEWSWVPQTHGIQAQQFCLYLLDYAKPEQKDLKLVEDLMRWSEDLGVDWRRPSKIAPGAQVYPYVAGGRAANSSSVNNLEMAIIYLKLYRHTKNPLHKAKAEALANAVLIAQDPEQGSVSNGVSATTDFERWAFWPWFHSWTVKYLYDYGQLLKQVEAGQ